MDEYSRRLKLPEDHPDHAEIRRDLCDHGMLGGDGRVRYFVSVLSSRNFLGVKEGEFVDVAKQLMLEITGHTTERFIYTSESLQWMWQLFEAEYRKQRPEHDLERKWSKTDEAIVHFLRQPDSTDSQLARLARTTEGQIKRCSAIRYLRDRFTLR